MLYYSIVPGEMIFAEEEEEPELVELNVDGVTIVVRQIDSNQGEIVKLISSDPQNYMNLDYQPGNIVEFVPQIQM